MDRIHKYLNLNNLLQIIQTRDPILAASAFRIFDLNFKNAEIEIVPEIKYSSVFYRNVFWPKKFCDEMTFSLILDRFGPILTKVKILIEIEPISRKMIEICSSNLIELGISIGTMGLKLEHTFENLRKLTLSISGPNVHESWMNINHYFPKLQSLEIENRLREKFEFCETLIDQSTKLKHFGLYQISYPNGAPLKPAQLALIGRFINVNKHLHSLALDGYSRNLDIIQKSVDWKIMEIEHLSISTMGIFPNLINVQQSKNLRSLNVSGLYDHEFEPFNIPKLEKLNVDLKCQNESFLNFLLKFKYLKNLTIGSCSHLILQNIERLGIHFDKLENVTFCMRWKRFDINKLIVLDEITRLMNGRQDLKSVNICLEYDYFPASTDHYHWMAFKKIEIGNWRMVIDYKGNQLHYLMNISFQNQNKSI